MNPMLDRIVAAKEEEVRLLREGSPSLSAEVRSMPLRDFTAALCGGDRIHLIAEIKFASPSSGRIREHSDPVMIAEGFEKAGASAISLITDREFFQGDLALLPRLKENISLPILRKDFIIDEAQVTESFLHGADAILLIARVLPPADLERLMKAAARRGMAVLTEVHDEEDLEKACRCEAGIIGINNRNLDTFEVDFSTTARLAPLVPKGCILVSESGVKTGEELRFLRRLNVQAVLVGTALMKSANPAGKAARLVRAGGVFHGEGKDMRHHEP